MTRLRRPILGRTCGLVLLLLVAGLVVGVGTHGATAQPAQPRTLSDRAEMSLVTGLPGDRLHTEFGHSAIRVHDPGRGFDWLYNYGTFNFGDPYFVPKFIYGDLQYFLSISTYGGTVDVYYRQGRPIITQQLNLTDAQKAALWAFLRHNARRENRSYRYDFLFDNCSTRIRDALKSALGDDVQFADTPDPDRSFRQMLDPYVADRPLLDLGFDIGLGAPADADVSAGEAMFLPEYLMAAADAATIRHGTNRVPLVARTDTVTWIEGYNATETAFPWPTLLTWLLFGVAGGWTAWQASTERAPGRWADATLLAIAGGAGLVMCFLWFVALHTVTNYNWNLVWAWPTHLVAAGLLLRSRSDGDGPAIGRWTQGYLAASAGACGLLAVGWSFVPQNLHAAVYPVVLLLALRCAWHAWYAVRTEPSASPPPPERANA